MKLSGYRGVTVLRKTPKNRGARSEQYVVRIWLLGKCWFLCCADDAPTAAKYWDIASFFLNAFRVYKDAARSHYNFPDKIQEHLKWVADASTNQLAFGHNDAVNLMDRINALKCRIHTLKTLGEKRARRVRPAWDHMLEVVGNLERRIDQLEADVLQLKNKS